MSAAPALRLDFKPSRALAGVLVAAHGLTLAAAWVSLAGWAQVLAGAGILVSLTGCLARILLRTSQSAVSLELHEDGRVSWQTRKGTWHEGRLGKSNFVSTGLVVLDLEYARHRRKWMLLAADSASPEDLRRLRVWLQWRRYPARQEPE